MSTSEYRQTTIREIAHINAHSVNGRIAPSHIEYIDISSVGTGEFIDAPKAMSFADAPSRARRIVKAGDTILSTVRPNRRSFLYLSAPSSIAIASTGFAVLTPTEHVDARYLYYWVTRQDFTDYLSLHAKGAAYPAVSAEDIGNGEIELPPLPIQRRIAGILSAYDELIENSQRRIKILESMARGLYREWFVHFRFPGHESVPRVKSPLGEIPEGWEVKKLKDVCRLTMGQSPKSEFYNETGEGVPFHQGVTDFGDRFPSDRLFCTAEGRIAQAGDILFSVRAPVGRLNIANKTIMLGRGLSAIRHNEDHQAFLWEQLRNRFTEVDMIGNGAIFASVTKDDMQSIDLICPPHALVESATRHFQALHSEIATLSRQIQNLRRTRDLLLPRLLSGQIDVEAIGS